MEKTKTTNWIKRGIVMTAAFAAMAVFSSSQANAQGYHGSGIGISIGSYGLNLNIGRVYDGGSYRGGSYGGASYRGYGSRGYSPGYKGSKGYSNYRRPAYPPTTNRNFNRPPSKRPGSYYGAAPGNRGPYRSGQRYR